MKHIYPSNPMAHRDQNKEVVGGAVLFGVLMLLIVGMFALATRPTNDTRKEQYVACLQVTGGSVSCNLQ